MNKKTKVTLLSALIMGVLCAGSVLPASYR